MLSILVRGVTVGHARGLWPTGGVEPCTGMTAAAGGSGDEQLLERQPLGTCGGGGAGTKAAHVDGE